MRTIDLMAVAKMKCFVHIVLKQSPWIILSNYIIMVIHTDTYTYRDGGGLE